jgi:fido (protein-threonine AMPylation protein)
LINQDQKNTRDDIKSAYENTPQDVIADASRFNTQFNKLQIGGNSASVSIGKMLTVMSEQDNTIRILSRILGREYNEQHLHDIHNSLFGNLDNTGGSDNRDGKYLVSLLTRLTTFIHEQNRQIQLLIDEVTKNVNQVTKQLEQTEGSCA